MEAIPCTCCKDDRIEKDLPPRELKIAKTSTENEGLPVYMCEFCDGPAYEMAMRQS